jgi:hypothetical protein
VTSVPSRIRFASVKLRKPSLTRISISIWTPILSVITNEIMTPKLNRTFTG